MSFPDCPFNYEEEEATVTRYKDDDGNWICSMDGEIITEEICCACVDSYIEGEGNLEK